MNALQTILSAIAFLWIFWGLYVLVMGLYRAHLDGRLTRLLYVMSAPYLLVGAAVDLIANLTVFSALFLDIPREWFVTARLKRLLRGDGWRQRLAHAICHKLLDVFDPSGSHC